MKNPGIAGLLSLLIPGAGQVYNGRFLWGIFWFLITPGLWIGSGGILGWICHILSAFQAYSQAKKRGRVRRGEGMVMGSAEKES